MKRFEFWNRLFNSGGNAGRPARRNGISIFVGTALIAVIAIVITACPGATPEVPVTNEFTVSYNVNGGDSTAPAAEKVTDGGTAAKPADPARNGYTFTGWFDAQSGGNEFNFGTAVTADITLYARWVKQHTVTYHANGGDDTPVPATQTVNHGETIAAAPTVSRTGFFLDTAWNTDANGTGASFLFGNEGTPVTEDITLYAQWSDIQHTVTYHANGGDGTPDPATQTVNNGDIIAAAPTGISKTGFTLSTAWNTQADGSGDAFLFGKGGTPVTEDITLYAQWSNTQHTVTYHANGGDDTPVPETQTVNDGDIIAAAPTVSKTGFTLSTAWNTKADGSGDAFLFGKGGTPVTEDITLYAQWSNTQHTVTYHVNEGTGTLNPATQAVNNGDIIAAAPTGISKTGFTLSTAWNTKADGTGTSFLFGSGGTAVTADITLYAQWTIKQYTVTYDVNGGIGTPDPATQIVNHGETIASAPTGISGDGGAFLDTRWTTKSDKSGTYFLFGDGGTPVTADITLYAQWSFRQYTVTYYANGGDATPVPATQKVNDGDIIPAAPTVSRTGYTLNAAWNKQADGGGDSFTFGSEGTTVTIEWFLYAQWTPITYTVTYNLNGGDSPAPAAETVDHDKTALEPADPTRSGYAFTGWSDAQSGGSEYIFGTKVTADIELYAQWIKQYTVSYDVNGGDSTTEPAAETVNDGGTATEPNDPSSTGQTFVGWFDAQTGGNEFNFGSGGTPVTKDITLYARWAATTYTVSYDVNGGDSTAPASETVPNGYTATEPPRPTRSNYAFTGWFDNQSGGNEFNFGNGGTSVTTNITLYAQWTQTFHTVSFDPNYGSGTPTTQNIPGGGTAVSESPSRTGYTLAGWSTAQSGGTLFDFDTTITAATTLYAQWTANKYAVSLNKNNGESGTPTLQATYDALLPTNQAVPTPPVYEYFDTLANTKVEVSYVFQGYFANNNGTGTQYYDKNMEPKNNWDQDSAATIYAHWKKPTYTVTLDINGGSNGGTTTSVVATLGEKLPLPGGILSPAISDNAKEFQGYTDDLRLSSVGRLYSGHRYYDTGGAGNKVKEGERVWDYPEDKTIYAYYGIINYGHEIIIKDPNDANYSGLTTIQSDGYFSYPSLPTRTGFSIAGYTENKDGLGTVWAHPPKSHGVGNWDWSQSSRTIYVKWVQD